MALDSSIVSVLVSVVRLARLRHPVAFLLRRGSFFCRCKKSNGKEKVKGCCAVPGKLSKTENMKGHKSSLRGRTKVAECCCESRNLHGLTCRASAAMKGGQQESLSQSLPLPFRTCTCAVSLRPCLFRKESPPSSVSVRRELQSIESVAYRNKLLPLERQQWKKSVRFISYRCS